MGMEYFMRIHPFLLLGLFSIFASKHANWVVPACNSCWDVPHPTSPKSRVGQGFIYLFEPSTYKLKLLGWYMAFYIVSKWVPIPLFLCSQHGCRSCEAHVVGPSMKSIGSAREGEGECWQGEWWEVPRPTSPKSWVGQGFIYLFGPSNYKLKLLDWYMASYNPCPAMPCPGRQLLGPARLQALSCPPRAMLAPTSQIVLNFFFLN